MPSSLGEVETKIYIGSVLFILNNVTTPFIFPIFYILLIYFLFSLCLILHYFDILYILV